jgi:DNA polymerase-3 subunit delta'
MRSNPAGATLLTNPDAWPLVNSWRTASGALRAIHDVCQSREQLLTVTGLNRELLLTDQLLRIEHYLQPGHTACFPSLRETLCF